MSEHIDTHIAPRPTDPFRREHAVIHEHLEHVRTWTGGLAASSADEARLLMKRIVSFFRQHILPHAEWEEQVLYPAVDRRAGAAQHAFTESMRYEHGIVGRWIDELHLESEKPVPDRVSFTRRADNLLGLIEAHFEEEEQVMLPILDESMTAADFEREIGGLGAH